MMFIKAAPKAVRKESRNAVATRGSVTSFQNPERPRSAPLMKMAESGPVEVFGNLRVHGQVTWPDRVFKKGYRLRTLEEVEEFVGRRKHLPDIPSEQEVAEQGVTVMDMFAKQLQKIEELTLYMIKLKKENKRLKKRMVVLEEKVNVMHQKNKR